MAERWGQKTLGACAVVDPPHDQQTSKSRGKAASFEPESGISNQFSRELVDAGCIGSFKSPFHCCLDSQGRMILLEGLVAPPSRRLSSGRLARTTSEDALATAMGRPPCKTAQLCSAGRVEDPSH